MTTTRLGFGCGGLMRVGSRRKRQDLLATAFDAGIQHFDVARMYGLGAAEAELGRFARGRRDRLTIATKFGIEATTAPWMSRLQGPARRLIGRYPALRRAVKRRDDAFHHPGRYDVATARKSLERSLTELGTDYIDILFVHDPPDAGAVGVDELGGFLESARAAGQIRAWGVAGEQGPLGELVALIPDGTVVQVRNDIFDPSVSDLGIGKRLITFGVLTTALERIVNQVRASEVAQRRWEEATGADCSDPEVVASLLLRNGLDANPDGVVLFNTTKPVRLGKAVATIDDGAPSLSAFQEMVLTEMGSAASVGRAPIEARR